MKTCYACDGQAACIFAYYGAELTYACDRHDPLTAPTMTTGGMSYYRRPIGPAEVVPQVAGWTTNAGWTG